MQADGQLITEYEIYHWITMAISIGLPYLILPIMIPGMCCVKMSAYTSINTANKFSISLKDQVVDERNFNRMLAAKVVLYLMLSAPRNVVRLFEKSPMSLTIDDELLMMTLTVLFELFFFFFFIALFFLYCCVGSKFICTLKRMCCCKSTVDVDFMY